MSSVCRSKRTRRHYRIAKPLITKVRRDVGDCRQPRQDTTRGQQNRLGPAMSSSCAVAKAKRNERYLAIAKRHSKKFRREFFGAKICVSESTVAWKICERVSRNP